MCRTSMTWICRCMTMTCLAKASSRHARWHYFSSSASSLWKASYTLPACSKSWVILEFATFRIIFMFSKSQAVIYSFVLKRWSCASWLVEWVASYSYYYNSFLLLGSALCMCHAGLLTGGVTKWLWCGMSRWVQMPSSRWHCRWRTWRMQGSWPWPTRRPWHVSTCMAVPRPCDRSPAKPPLLLSKTHIQNSKYFVVCCNHNN